VNTFAINNRHIVFDYFAKKLEIRHTEDFRGVLHVPIECRRQLANMEDVGIAVAYAGFNGRTCCMHTVIARPDLVSPRIVRETFEFPFLVCNLEAVIALVDSTNDKAMSFDTKLGFREVHRIPNGGNEGDLCILQMRRADCRWLRKPH
jgi:hypothetical protein